MVISRTGKGNTLALIAATTIVLMVVLAFGLLYMSMNRSSSEHRTAIDAAALAAANDISRIVVNTQQFGFVALSTEPPTGSDTKANDDYYQDVTSLNELMATARLDLIIATELADPFMTDLATQDYNDVLLVKDALVTELTNAIQSGGSGKDKAGNILRPYDDAERIYLKNQAKGSTYVTGSLRLTLGGVEGGIETGTPAPKPLSKGACAGKESNNRYLSEVNIPYGGKDFVFGSVGRKVGLCDKTKFKAAVPGLPYQMPGVVLAEASQHFSDQGKTWTVTYAACACAGSSEPPRPAPGALTLSFPDGPIPEVVNAADAWNWKSLASKDMDVYQVKNADFIVEVPKGAALVTPWPGAPIPFSKTQPPASEVTRLALYDWLRCGGSNVDIDSVLALSSLTLDTPSPSTTPWKAIDPQSGGLQLIGPLPTGIMHILTFNTNGTTKYVSKTIQPYPYTTVGENQLYGEFAKDDGVKSNVKATQPWKFKSVHYLLNRALKTDGEVEGTDKIDVYVRDLSRCLGSKGGGKHGGERLDGNPLISQPPLGSLEEDWICFNQPQSEVLGTTGGGGPGAPNLISKQDDFASSTIPTPPYTVYTQGPGGGAPRPAYLKNGLSGDIRFRRQVKIGDAYSFVFGGVKTGYVGEMLP